MVWTNLMVALFLVTNFIDIVAPSIKMRKEHDICQKAEAKISSVSEIRSKTFLEESNSHDGLRWTLASKSLTA